MSCWGFPPDLAGLGRMAGLGGTVDGGGGGG